MDSTYAKGGSAGSKGVDFQVGLSSILLLKALQTLKDWRLSIENKNAGKFDDVVLELSDNSAILLQAKYKEHTKKKITLNQLLSTDSKNDDFSIPKYFFSYLEVKKTFSIKTVIVCTNAHFDQTFLPFLKCQRLNSDSMLYYEGSCCLLNTLKDDIIPHLKESAQTYHKLNLKGKGIDETVITEENMKDFFKDFRLIFSYLPENGMEPVVEQLLFNLKCSDSIWEKASPQDVFNKIKSWFQRPKGEYLTESRAKGLFCEIRSDKFCQSIEQYKVLFYDNHSIFTDSKRLYHFIADDGYMLQVVRIYHSLKSNKDKVLYVSPDDDIEVQKQVLEAFGLPHYTCLTIISPKCKKHSDLNEMSHTITEILKKFYYKKVILVTEQKSGLVQEITVKYQSFKVVKPVTFDNFSKDTQKKLWKKNNIYFQGSSTSLKELFGTEDYNKSIDSETLEKLVIDENIEVGVKPLSLKEDVSRHYIDRSFKRVIKKGEEMETMEVTSEKGLCKVEEKLILISDYAGMGKSTVLTKLAGIMKKKNPQLWVITVQLSDFTQVFKDYQRRNIESINIMQMLDSREEPMSRFERLIFSMKEKVVLMLDGVDEVCPDYTQLVLSLLSQCKEACNLSKIFVTTRQHLAEELKAKLLVEPYMLEPLTEQNQIDFLSSYWAYNLGVDRVGKKKCEQYAKALIEQTWEHLSNEMEDRITAVPLQLRMMAEIFQENITGGSTSWKGCKEYIQSGESVRILPNEMNIMTLYKMFIEKKKDVFIDKANPSGNSIVNQALVDVFDNCLDNLRSLALDCMLDKSECALFSCYQQKRSSTDSNVLRIGMVETLHKNLQFVHKTFAEYFLAQSVLEELQGLNENPEFQKFFIDGFLTCTDFKVTRKFLDSMLRDVVCVLPSNIFQNYQSLEQKTDFSEAYNTTLIHLLAGEGCVAILQLIFKCIGMSVVSDKEVYVRDLYGTLPKNIPGKTLHIIKQLVEQGGVNIKDEIGWTPLHCAVQSRRLEMIRFLVRYGANVNCKDDEGRTALHIATSYHTPSKEPHARSRKKVRGFKTWHISSKRAQEDVTTKEALNFRVIRFLVGRGASVRAKDKYGRNAFYNITRNAKNLDVLLYLVYSVYQKDEFDETDSLLLYTAAFNGALDSLNDTIDRRLVRGVTKMVHRDKCECNRLSYSYPSSLEKLMEIGQFP